MLNCYPDKLFHNIARALNGLMLALFLPVLFCVMFIGNRMNYLEDVKADILVPNALLTLMAMIALGIGLWLLGQGRKFLLNKRTARYMSLVLTGLFTFFFFFCLMISNETVFDMSVDQGIVRRTAIEVAQGIPLGYRYEFSIDYNNIPITYILGRLYGLAESWTWFKHNPEYLWIIVGCLAVTAAGFCCCEIVKKMTKNPAAVLITFGLYLLTAGLCPWKYIPYTDSYGILFPVLCLLLYLYSRDCKSIAGKALLNFFACLSGMIGGFIKPSAYIAILAMLGVAALDLITAVICWSQNREDDEKKAEVVIRVRSSGIALIFGLFFTCTLYGGSGLYTKYIINAIELEYNEELESTLQYYFFSSTNEDTTGSFSIQDYGVFGEFQFSKADRNAACMERAWERIRQRGTLGTMYFCLRKLVKSFNDGTFAWTDVRYYEPFPEDLTHHNAAAEFLRALFMPEQSKQAWYDTFAELVWIFLLLGVPGVVLEKTKKDRYIVFVVLIIGILTYLMLFESGARYLYIFLPVFTAVSVCGMELMGVAVSGIYTARKDGTVKK